MAAPIVVSPSLFGTWQLNKEASDAVPPIQNIHEAPLSSLAVGDLAEQFRITARHDTQGVEELLFWSKSAHGEHERVYQLGKFNIEKYYNSEVIIAIVVAATRNCESLVIVRYGPSASSQSSEKFSIDPQGTLLKVEIDVVLPNGTISKCIKYYNRRLPAKQISPRGISNERCVASFGWLYQEFRSATILPQATVQVVDAWTIVSPKMKLKSSCNGLNKQVAEGLSVTRCLNNKVTDGENVILYLIQIDLLGRSWFVVHRYKEFDALRLYIASRKHLRSERYWSRVGSEPPFPRKTAGLSLQLSGDYPQYVRDRIKHLETFLQFHITHGGHEVQSVVDAICSFLEIPEHLKSAEEVVKVAQVEARPPLELARKTLASSRGGANAQPASTAPATTTAHSTAPTAAQQAMASASSAAASRGQPAAPTTAVTKTAGSSAPNQGGRTSITTTQLAMTSANVSSIAQVAISARDLTGLSTIIPIGIPPETSYRYPQDALYAVLNIGLVVIKHGRQGKPKKRLLRCDGGMTRIYWCDVPDPKKYLTPGSEVLPDLPAESKSVTLLEAIEIRRGTEEDYDDASTVAGTVRDDAGGAAKVARPSTAAGTRVKYGTKILRKNKIKPEEMAISFSIILKDRSFDIQCLNDKDFRFLYGNLFNFWKASRGL